MSKQLTQKDIDSAVDLGTVYPSTESYANFKRRRQKLADSINNGAIGNSIRYYQNGRGTECYYDPSIKARWTENFS
jgi:hypothetical protein